MVLPAPVREIGSHAFAGCAGLTAFTVPEGVAGIYGFVFYNCRSLERVTLPGSVTEIAVNAFEHNTPAAIQAPLGSAAEVYAQKYGIKFIPMEETVP